MSGLKSRRKGNRGEYLIRDVLRSYGYEVDRIPASGAAQGFKGDLRLRSPNKELVVEVKLRKDGFSKIYDLADQLKEDELGMEPWSKALISLHPVNVIDHEFREVFLIKVQSSDLKALDTCKKLKVGSDILVIKADYRPPVYLRWMD